LTRQVDTNGLKVKCALSTSGFYYAHFRIENGSTESVEVRPKAFLLRVVKPRPYVLYFEYPERVQFQTIKGISHFYPRYLPGQPTRPDAEETYSKSRDMMFKGSNRIIPDSLIEMKLMSKLCAECGIPAIEGNVYFQTDWKARDVIVVAFIGDFAFEFPFSLPKR
jgi:hypothetical protein